MEDKQHFRQYPTLVSPLLLLALGILVSVLIVFGLFLTTDSHSHHFPSPFSPNDEQRPPAEREKIHPPPGLTVADSSITGTGSGETASGDLQQLLEATESGEEGVGEGVNEELTTRCGETNTQQPCGPGEMVLNFVPPETAETLKRQHQTFLLLGVDSRSGNLISLTDTIMLLVLDESKQQLSLLSIPRDLYVSIPGHGRDRINTVVVHGAKANDDDLQAGIALLQETIEQTLDIDIDHYVVIDFRAVVRSIDALGGIDVYVPYNIDDPTFPDMNGGFDPLYIPQGQHHFDGELALKYARTRHQDNDFYRAQRQQQILLAIRQQVFHLGVTDILASVPTLYQQVRQGVFTDLSLMQLIQLGQVMSDIPLDDIRTEVLDGEYVLSSLTDAGESVLLLKPAAASFLVNEMFSN